MDATHYEIYVKPTDGPCSVQERDSQGNFAWLNKDYAIFLASEKKTQTPSLDFLVIEQVGHRGPRSLVFDTSKRYERHPNKG
jgi:hypothetical protein